MSEAQAKKMTLAEQADRHILYQESVQAPEAEVEFFEKTFKELKGHDAKSMREDFCGTAFLSLEWVKSDPERSAIGVDLCKDTLNWGMENNIKPASKDIQSRIRLINGNVLDEPDEKVDVTCALNFSYMCFETRELLRQYFENALKGLKDDGILVLDLMGGSETLDELEEERDVDDEDYKYIWDQDSFNPIDHHMQCYIHFSFPDGSMLKRAFSYAWRVWTIPELRELLVEAGFKNVRVYWEEFEDTGDDDDDELEGTGDYYEQTEVEQQESWITYIVAEA